MTAPVAPELIIVAFDIAHDKRRRLAVRILEHWGDRVLESVFECWLEPAKLRTLQKDLGKVLHPEDDLLALYRLAPQDASRAWHIGTGSGLTRDIRTWIA